MAREAETWHRQPSRLLLIDEPVVARAVDEALHFRLLVDERRLSDEARGRAGGLPPGQRYATEADYPANERIH